MQEKSLVICGTQFAGGLLLKKLKYSEVMLNIFEFSRVWENVESWLVYANKFFWIVQSYFSTDVIKQSQSQLLFLAFKTFNRYDLCISRNYFAVAKYYWVIKLGELKSDQKYFAK